MREYPYTLRTFGRNVKEYGLASAVIHDLDRTNENMSRTLDEIVDGAILGLAMVIAVPYLAYLTYKNYKKYNEARKIHEKAMKIKEELGEE